VDRKATWSTPLEPAERVKAALLSSWFFVTVATFWLLKPVRIATLLAHLGARETPYVRLAAVGIVAVVVAGYSAIVNRITRVQLVRVANVGFALVLGAFWLAWRFFGPAIEAERAFVWAIYVMVELYSVLMIGVFWTYVNDIVTTTSESNRLYGIIGLGGILGGTAGGAFVDLFAKRVGPMNLLLACAVLVLVCAALGSITERVLQPPERRHEWRDAGHGAALEGMREVMSSRYLTLLVFVVIAYELTSTLTDFGINVVFEHSFKSEGELTQMYGRLGWIASATAVVSQVVLVPLLLPSKRIALLLPPFAMIASAVGVVVLPVLATAMILGITDRGLNYSIQQSTWESLYVPLDAEQKYKAKAFIDMFVDRAAKAGAAFILVALIAASGASVRTTVMISVVSTLVWIGSARRLARYWRKGEFKEPSHERRHSSPSRPPSSEDEASRRCLRSSPDTSDGRRTCR
jgi:AAA family ATP:ADP antiporter